MFRWLKLSLYSIVLLGFIFVFPLLMKGIDSYQQIMEKSEELEIDNSSLFYSDEIWTLKAESTLKMQLDKKIGERDASSN